MAGFGVRIMPPTLRSGRIAHGASSGWPKIGPKARVVNKWQDPGPLEQSCPGTIPAISTPYHVSATRRPRRAQGRSWTSET
jgi:hypothetical protein